MSALRKYRVVINGHARRNCAGAVRAFYLPAGYINGTVAVVVDLDEFIIGAARSASAEFTDDCRRKVIVKNRCGARTFLDNRASDICDIDEERFSCFDVRIAVDCQIE